jgi:hypothetical protein
METINIFALLPAMKHWLKRMDNAIAARHIAWIKELLNEDLAHPAWAWTEAPEELYTEYCIFCERAQNILRGQQ